MVGAMRKVFMGEGRLKMVLKNRWDLVNRLRRVGRESTSGEINFPVRIWWQE